MALKKKEPSLCNRVEGYAPSDMAFSRDQAIELCKFEYHVQIGDVDYCRNLGGENVFVNKTDCLLKVAEKFHLPDLCEELEFSGFKKDMEDFYKQRCREGAKQ